MSGQGVLPYGRQTIEQDDIRAVEEVLRSPWLTGGPAVDRFEAALEEATGAPFAVACANGTAALHLAAMALDLGPEDWVVVPAVTFLATANAARFVGAEVLFADVDPDTGLLTVETLTKAITAAKRRGRRVRAVFPVHLNGQVADPTGISETARTYGLSVVEDSCHALGTRFDGPRGIEAVGASRTCDMATFSFHPVKTIAMGEGGAVTTRSAELAKRLRYLRNHGMLREPTEFQEQAQAFAANGEANPWYYEMAEVGFNYRASDLHCALGASQMAKLPRFVASRRSLAAVYDSKLSALRPLVRPLGRVSGCTPAWHLYVVLVDFAALGAERAAVMDALSRRGIQTQVHYLPVNRQPYYLHRYGRTSLGGADGYYERALTLPLYPGMNEHDVDRIVSELRDVLET